MVWKYQSVRGQGCISIPGEMILNYGILLLLLKLNLASSLFTPDQDTDLLGTHKYLEIEEVEVELYWIFTSSVTCYHIYFQTRSYMTCFYHVGLNKSLRKMIINLLISSVVHYLHSYVSCLSCICQLYMLGAEICNVAD